MLFSMHRIYTHFYCFHREEQAKAFELTTPLGLKSLFSYNFHFKAGFQLSLYTCAPLAAQTSHLHCLLELDCR